MCVGVLHDSPRIRRDARNPGRQAIRLRIVLRLPLSISAFAAGRRGIVSPCAKPCARSPTGPPPCQTPDRSGCPSARRGVGPCGVVSRGRALSTSGFALPPAGAVASAGSGRRIFAGAGRSLRRRTKAHTNAIASNCGPLRLDFTVVLLQLCCNLLRRSVARRKGKDLLSIGQRDGSGIGHLRSVLGLGAFHRHLIAHFQGVPGPSLAYQHVGTGEFQIPVTTAPLSSFTSM